MNITWTNEDNYHHATLPESEDTILAIRQQVTKVLELAEDKEDWDCVMMDIWMDNLGRLICNIQNKDQAVGMDRGYRVALQFETYHNQILQVADDQYGSLVNKLKDNLVTKIRTAFNDSAFLMSFDDLWTRNPFNIRFASQGQLLNVELNFT